MLKADPSLRHRFWVLPERSVMVLPTHHKRVTQNSSQTDDRSIFVHYSCLVPVRYYQFRVQNLSLQCAQHAREYGDRIAKIHTRI
jgi:hypothetical protein